MMSVPVRSATAEHAALVRSALTLDERVQGGNKGPLAALAALVALAEQADDLLRQRTELQNSIGNNVVTVDTLVREKSEGWTRALSAEARVAELEHSLRVAHETSDGYAEESHRYQARVAELERQRNEARTQRARLYLIERERVAELETTLKRIIAQFETNSEAGAPQYLFDALAAGSPTGQEQQA